MSDAYDRVTYQGHPMDKMTRQAIIRLEAALGYPKGSLTVMQGCYAHRVAASAGTHDGGGAFDLSANDWARKVKLGRKLGLAIWHRPAIRGLWPEHVHAIVIGNDRLSPSAYRQTLAYRSWRDGLVSNNRDYSYHPVPIKPYQYLSSTAVKHQQEAAEEAADMKPEEIATAPFVMLKGLEDTPRKTTLQNVLRDLEGTQDRHGRKLAAMDDQLDRIEALLKALGKG